MNTIGGIHYEDIVGEELGIREGVFPGGGGFFRWAICSGFAGRALPV